MNLQPEPVRPAEVLADAQLVAARICCDPNRAYLENGQRICNEHGFWWPDGRAACNEFEDHELAALRMAQAVLAGSSLAALNVRLQQIADRNTAAVPSEYSQDVVRWLVGVLTRVAALTAEKPAPVFEEPGRFCGLATAPSGTHQSYGLRANCSRCNSWCTEAGACQCCWPPIETSDLIEALTGSESQ